MRVLVLASFPPRECGIATFTKDVVDNLGARLDVRCEVIAIDESSGEARRYGPQVVARLKRDDPAAYGRTAGFINAHPADALLVQHEYGLFASEDGEALLALLAAVRKPVVVALHTILPQPSAHHRAVTRRIGALAHSTVVLSRTGQDILQRVYGADAAKIRVIPHGVPDVPFSSTAPAKNRLGLGDRSLISTFGLLSRGKGLEDAIWAMRTVAAAHPEVLYLILGETHPGVRLQEGESYRQSLHSLVTTHGLQDNVAFVNRYLSFEDLLEYLAASDIYLTPYLNAGQIVSGTLAYAAGCGKAIVSTPYLYAQELLAEGRGLLCDFRNPDSIAEEVGTLLAHPEQRHTLERRAYQYGRSMKWSTVASSYARALRDATGSTIGEPVRYPSLPSGWLTPPAHSLDNSIPI